MRARSAHSVADRRRGGGDRLADLQRNPLPGPPTHWRRAALLAAGAGATAAICWLPFGLAPLLPLSFLLAMRGLRRVATTREAVWFGVIYGAVRYAVATHFFVGLLRFSSMAIVLYLMVIAFILPFAILESWGAYRLEKRFGLPRSVGLMLLYPLMEKVRTIGDLSFPADIFSHAFGTNPGWLAWTPWLGPFAVSLLALGVAVFLDQALERPANRAGAVSLALLAAGLWLAPPATERWLRPVAESRPGLRVGIVQPGATIEDKLDRSRWPDQWNKLERLTLRAAKDVDLVVWPETARPGFLTWKEGDSPLPDPRMQALSERAGVPILYGCEIARIEGDRVTALYNAAALARPARTHPSQLERSSPGGEWYGKQRLLPFIEGVPFARWIGWDPAKRKRSAQRSYLSLVGNFLPGPRPTVFEVGRARIGVLICFEGLYPHLGRRYRDAGANALLVITNDAWWGRTVFARWHAQMIASQARSLDMPVIRAANSGVSSATDRSGRMHDSTDLFEVTILRTKLEPTDSAPTFYARSGNLIPYGILAFLVGFIGASAINRRLRKKG